MIKVDFQFISFKPPSIAYIVYASTHWQRIASTAMETIHRPKQTIYCLHHGQAQL